MEQDSLSSAQIRARRRQQSRNRQIRLKKAAAAAAVIICMLFSLEILPPDQTGGRSYHAGIIGGADGPTTIILGSGNGTGDGKKDPAAASRKDSPNVPEQPDADQTGSAEEPPGPEQGKADGGAQAEPVPADLSAGILILVNRNHTLEKDYVPEDLTPIRYYAEDRSAEGRYMRKEAAEAFHRMAEAAGEEGHRIVMTTAYRSYGFQSTLYNGYVNRFGREEAERFSARPGTSEHQTGLAVDISAPSVGYRLTNEFDKTPEWAWLSAHAPEYGFILRYGKGKEGVTGYQYEAWHFRYVGKDAAEKMTAAGLTLEEYLQELQKKEKGREKEKKKDGRKAEKKTKPAQGR